jgi:hypothetical protein
MRWLDKGEEQIVKRTAWLPILLFALAGCGGGGNAPIITGITVSPGSVVTAGQSVTLTATVRNSTNLKQAVWSADGGTMSVDTGTRGVWIAPTDITETTVFTITLVATETTGLRGTASVKIAVEPGGVSTTALRITATTVQSSVVRPGGENTFSVSVSNSANLISVKWRATAGVFIQDDVPQVKWIAPTDVVGDQWVTIDVEVMGTQGEVDTKQMRVLVSGAGYSIITGFQVSPSATVNPGGEATVTVSVDDAASVKEVRWSANGGTLAVDTGTTCRWIAPRGVAKDTVYVITATVTNNRGLQSQGSVKVIVAGTS